MVLSKASRSFFLSETLDFDNSYLNFSWVAFDLTSCKYLVAFLLLMEVWLEPRWLMLGVIMNNLLEYFNGLEGEALLMSDYLLVGYSEVCPGKPRVFIEYRRERPPLELPQTPD